MLTELRYAFYIAALSFIWLMMEYLLGLHDRYIEYYQIVSMFAFLIPAVFMYYGLQYKRDVDYDGSFTLGQCFKSGLVMTLLVVVMMVPVQLAFDYLINPRFFDNMVEHAVQHATANGKDAAQARRDAVNDYNVKTYLLQSVIGILVIGLLLTAVYGFVLTRRKTLAPTQPPADTLPQTPAP